MARGRLETTTVFVIFSLLTVATIAIIFISWGLPRLAGLSYSACWNQVTAYVTDIDYQLEGTTVLFAQKGRNMTVELGDCALKMEFINFDTLIRNKERYTYFFEKCEAAEGGAYILAYPSYPEEVGTWWLQPVAYLRGKLKEMVIEPVCEELEYPFSANVLKNNEILAGQPYCLVFPERPRDLQEHDFIIQKGRCE